MQLSYQACSQFVEEKKKEYEYERSKNVQTDHLISFTIIIYVHTTWITQLDDEKIHFG